MTRLGEALTQISLSSGQGYEWPPKSDPDRSPYPGLESYQEEDAAVFCGRDDEIRAVLEHLHARRVQWGQSLLMVVGSRGAGKSSLLRAGVIPRLKRLAKQWIVLPPFRPHPDPCGALAAALSQCGVRGDWDTVRQRLLHADSSNDLHGTWQRMAQELQEHASAPNARILIAIDQGEELVFEASDKISAGLNHEEAHRFFRWLKPALASDLPFQALITIASDCQMRLRQSSGLGELMSVFALPRLPLERVADIIRIPAQRANFAVEEALLSKAQRDLNDEKALPLLGFVLRQLHARNLGKQKLSLMDYQAMGTADTSPLDQVVSQSAEEVLKSMRDQDQGFEATMSALRSAFLRLVRVDPEDGFRRRPALLEGLPPAAHDTLRRLAKARLVTIDGEGATERVDVAHEALLHHWPTLTGWLQEQREFLVGLDMLKAQLRLWRDSPPPDKEDALLENLQLGRASKWLRDRPEDFDQDLCSFVKESADRADRIAAEDRRKDEERRQQELENQKQKRRKQRQLAMAGWGLALVGVAGVVITTWLWQRSQRAETAQFTSLHLAKLDTDPLQSVVDGLAALNRQGLRGGAAIELAASLQRALSGLLAHSPAIPAHQQGVTTLAMLSDNEWISGGADGRVRRWRHGSTSNVEAVSAAGSGGRGAVTSLLVLPNGDWISGSDDGSLMRWRQGVPEGHLQRPDSGAVVSLLALPSGDWVSGSARGTLVIWRGDRPLRAPIESRQGRIWTMAAAPAGGWASGGGDGTVRKWQADGTPSGPAIRTGQGAIFSLLFRSSGDLVSGGANGRLQIRTADGRLTAEMRNVDDSSVWGLAELGNGDLLSAGRSGTLQQWRGSMPVGQPLKTGHRGEWSLVNSPDRRNVVSFGVTRQDDSLRLWQLGGAASNRVPLPGGSLWSVALDRRGEIVSGWRDGRLRRGLKGPAWGTVSGEGIWKLERLSGGELLSIGSEGGLRRWSASAVDGRRRPGSSSELGQMIEHQAGDLLSVREHRGGWLVGDRQGRVWFWPGGKPAARPLLTGGAPIYSLLSLPDGWLSGLSDGRLLIVQGRQLSYRDSGQARVLSLAALPDGEWLSGGGDGTLLRWRGGQPVGSSFPTGQTAVWGLLALDNGDLLSVGEEGLSSTVRLFSPRWVAQSACAQLVNQPVLRKPDGPAAREARHLCEKLNLRPGVVYGSLPTHDLLQADTASRHTENPVITLPSGDRLRWDSRRLNRVDAGSLEAWFTLLPRLESGSAPAAKPLRARLNCRRGFWVSLPERRMGRPDSPALASLFDRICARLNVLPPHGDSAREGEAFVYDPPVNVRIRPNESILCEVKQRREIHTFTNDAARLWLRTDACGSEPVASLGYMLRALVRF